MRRGEKDENKKEVDAMLLRLAMELGVAKENDNAFRNLVSEENRSV